MPKAGKKASMSEQLGRRVTVTTVDRDRLDGRFLGYDKHMNLVLSDCERSRPKRRGGFERQSLGFVVLRGEAIASVSVERSFAAARTHVDSVRDAKAPAAVLEGDRLSELSRAAQAIRTGAVGNGLALN